MANNQQPLNMQFTVTGISELRRAAKVMKENGIAATQMSRSVKKASNRTVTFAANLYKLRTIVSMVTNGLRTLSSVYTSFLKASAERSDIGITFTTMLGSAEKAREMLESLHELAKVTPFNIPEVEKNAVMLTGMGVEANELVSTMSMLADITAGLPNTSMERLSINLGQVKAATVLTGRELKDFAQSGITVLGELQKLNKYNHLSKGGVRNAIEKRIVTYEDVIQAFKNMTSEGGRFFGLAEKKMGTMKGKYSNAMDKVIKAWRNIGDNLAPRVIRVLENIDSIMVRHGKTIETILTAGLLVITKVLRGISNILDSLWITPLNTELEDTNDILGVTDGKIKNLDGSTTNLADSITKVESAINGIMGIVGITAIVLISTKLTTFVASMKAISVILTTIATTGIGAVLTQAGGWLIGILTSTVAIFIYLLAVIQDVWATVMFMLEGKEVDSLLNRFFDTTIGGFFKGVIEVFLNVVNVIYGVIVGLVWAVVSVIGTIGVGMYALVEVVVAGFRWVWNMLFGTEEEANTIFDNMQERVLSVMDKFKGIKEWLLEKMHEIFEYANAFMVQGLLRMKDSALNILGSIVHGAKNLFGMGDGKEYHYSDNPNISNEVYTEMTPNERRNAEEVYKRDLQTGSSSTSNSNTVINNGDVFVYDTMGNDTSNHKADNYGY